MQQYLRHAIIKCVLARLAVESMHGGLYILFFCFLCFNDSSQTSCLKI